MKTIVLALMASAILGVGSLALGNGTCTTAADSSCCCDPCPLPCPVGCCE